MDRNAPHYENNSDAEIIKYIDPIIKCQKMTNNNNNKSIELQIYKHSKSCIKKSKQYKKM